MDKNERAKREFVKEVAARLYERAGNPVYFDLSIRTCEVKEAEDIVIYTRYNAEIAEDAYENMSLEEVSKSIEMYKSNSLWYDNLDEITL
jgi:hypothetical protein